MQISFISANYVGRALNYQGGEDWGKLDAATIAAASAEHFRQIVRDVKGAGFTAIDIWTAHCHWQRHAQGDYPEAVKKICAEEGLKITSYAGGLNGEDQAVLEAAFAFMKRIGAPIFAGGIGGKDRKQIADRVEALCQKHGLRWGYENHPEKSIDEIIAKIDGGRAHVGIALDTGWCGTQGVDALAAAKAVRKKLQILHLKDVRAAGGHDTCALGEGIVPVEEVLRWLVGDGWDGTICIEHEPYDRDPMDEVKRSLERVRKWLQ